jgi:hypothetical protein
MVKCSASNIPDHLPSDITVDAAQRPTPLIPTGRSFHRQKQTRVTNTLELLADGPK